MWHYITTIGDILPTPYMTPIPQDPALERKSNSELYICKHGKVLYTVYAFYLRILYVVEFTLLCPTCYMYSYYYISIPDILLHSQNIIFF